MAAFIEISRELIEATTVGFDFAPDLKSGRMEHTGNYTHFEVEEFWA